jgi:hypothetical protein
VSSQAANPPERQATCLWRARPDRGRLASGGGFAARPASRLLFSNRWLTILTATNTAVHAKISVRPLISRTIDYSCERRRNPTPKRETSSAPIRKRISSAASCAWQICRRAPWIASAAMNTCCGGKRDRLWLRWSRCGTASDSRAVQPFHFSFRRREPGAVSEAFRVTTRRSTQHTDLPDFCDNLLSLVSFRRIAVLLDE